MKTYKIAGIKDGAITIDPADIREVGRPMYGDEIKITLRLGGLVWLEADYYQVLLDITEAENSK